MRPPLLLGHMKAGSYNIQITQGTLYEKTFTWTNGGPINLTGFTAKLKVKVAGLVVLSLTDVLDGAGNGLVLGGSDGTVELVIKTAKTQTFAFTKGTYECQLTRPDGEDIRVCPRLG
jgi:hypothetical protein